MKNLFKIIIAAILLLQLIRCENSNNKPNAILLSEEITITSDTITNLNDSLSQFQTPTDIWEFISVNDHNLNNYVYETIPYLIFSIDSSYVFINSGCNTYIGECKFEQNQKISFDKILIKDENCPINALEREIIYMLDISDYYLLNNNNLILYSKDIPIGFLNRKQTVF